MTIEGQEIKPKLRESCCSQNPDKPVKKNILGIYQNIIKQAPVIQLLSLELEMRSLCSADSLDS